MGARVLAAGGNAADAAVATALALGVVRPASSGIGGGGFALVYDARRRTVFAYDFREQAPAALTPDAFAPGGEVDPSLSRAGGLAVAVPGEVAGLEAISRRHGRLPFRRAVAPAIALARRGFRADPFFAAQAAAWRDRQEVDASLRAQLARVEPGAVVRRPRLARTLDAIARRGARGFYAGWVARDLVAAVVRRGGVMTLADLAGYRVREPQPLWGTWRGLRIAAMPLPSSGGLTALAALGILEAGGWDLAQLGAGSSAALHLTAEALKHAFADRARLLGDAGAALVSPERFLDRDRLRQLARRINPLSVDDIDRYGDPGLGGAGAPAGDAGTSHLCVIDADGNAVSLTTTINLEFGSGVVGARSGVILNNEIDDFSLRSGVPNAFGLVQSDANLVGGGKRPLSSMSPTLVFDGDRVIACAGGSGGPRIISNVVQVLLNVFVYGMDAAEAVAAPRIHHQWKPDVLRVEAEVPRDVVTLLRLRGHRVDAGWRNSSAVQLIVVRPDGTREAASDPRKLGWPAAAAR